MFYILNKKLLNCFSYFLDKYSYKYENILVLFLLKFRLTIKYLVFFVCLSNLNLNDSILIKYFLFIPINFQSHLQMLVHSFHKAIPCFS